MGSRSTLPIDDPEWLLPHLHRLTDRSEAERRAPAGAPWRVDDAPTEFIAQQMRAIVGVEIRVTRLEGKWKMSQNRTADSIDAVVQGGLYAAYSEKKELSTQSLLDALTQTVPLSVTRAEEIATLREWARTRAVPASAQDAGLGR